MNIFIFKEEPKENAKYLSDVHLRKMIVESCQLLSTAIRDIDKDNNYEYNQKILKQLYKPTHNNHPCTKWVKENSANFMWLKEYTIGLLNEFEFRFDKKHKSQKIISLLNLYGWEYSNIKYSDEKTPFIFVGKDEYKQDKDIFKSYYQYYLNEKQYNKNGKDIFYFTHRRNPFLVTNKI